MDPEPVTGAGSERRFFKRLVPGRFRERLLLAMVTLVVGSQLIAGYALSETVREDSFAKASKDLDIGRRIFARVLESRSTDLLESVRVLSADFGFKSAVATRDTATIGTVLENHGARIGADLVLLLDNPGTLIAASRSVDDALGSRPFPRLHLAAQRMGEATAVGIVGDRLVQLVAVPVRAPVPIAWVMMGFNIDGALAEEMRELTGLEVSFAGASGDGRWRLVSTLDADVSAALVEALPEITARGGVRPFEALDGRFLSVLVDLPVVAPDRGLAVLQMPSSEIAAAYSRLQGQFLVVLMLTLALALVVGLAFANGISRPIQRLIDAAQDIRAGNYGNRVEVRGGGEIGLLAVAINGMQEGIAERETQIRFQATHDELTGLPNRRFVEEDIGARLAAGRHFALLLLSINGFRSINDALGYDVGDRVLCGLADRLRASMRRDTQIARIGGDEFLIVIEDVDAGAALRRAGEIRAQLGQTIEVDGSPVAMSVSLGVVASPEHGDDANRLLRRADIALGAAKTDRAGIRAYVPGQDEQHLRELQLMRDLVGAIETRSLSMRYQPKVTAGGGEVEQVEALVRWEHPEFGFVPPDEFVFLAERSGLVRGLTSVVLEMVLDDLAAWRQRGLELVVCVNLSARDLADVALPGRVRAALAARGLSGRDLVLEITESALLEDPDRAVQVLDELRRADIDLSVDDFGTGYSSLAQLRRLPVSELKIDKSFVLALEDSEGDRVIVQSTIALGHALGLTVVAEGVETAAAWRLLEAFDCDRLQGYYIARPMVAEALLDWLDAWQPGEVKAQVAAA
ncbi:MAG TPA: EAL domain-containing protein [Pseudomonadales bacterium]|nr:EAL domain-containing protein [Pseudomonadales bacterium]